MSGLLSNLMTIPVLAWFYLRFFYRFCKAYVVGRFGLADPRKNYSTTHQGIRDEIEIIRDEYGVAHVLAFGWLRQQDLLHLQKPHRDMQNGNKCGAAQRGISKRESSPAHGIASPARPGHRMFHALIRAHAGCPGGPPFRAGGGGPKGGAPALKGWVL